jgi:hypothetical protein
MQPEIGMVIELNSGTDSETLLITTVGEYITFQDRTWMDFRTWKTSLGEGRIKVLSSPKQETANPTNERI